ncbi:MAG TPA: CocE/NonD family hydrolase [Chitinophagales bacterium]|nr:CocE/NonD family hydrolase [Chitinophagales bacterium]HRK25754.1 CocE/NonD family hydrolase [Chitinophagales bacterium]
MLKKITCLIFVLLFSGGVHAQISVNGQIEDLTELSSKITVPFTMPDGTQLMTDVTVPMLGDSLVLDLNFSVPIFGQVSGKLQVLPKGAWYIIYETLNGQPNDNPYRLPVILTRTPYNKSGEDVVGAVVSVLGYAYCQQDMRGRYASGGVYLPMYSDGWRKDPYHPDIKHVLDVTDFNDPRNGNYHEDGYHSIKYIVDSLQFTYDIDSDGVPDFTDYLCNGSVGMFGASALGNTQLQSALAHRVNPMERGLKCLMPIVAASEHYKCTGYQNGVFRDRLVTGWLRGQIFSGTNDDFFDIDESLDNNIHTSRDYGLTNMFDAANNAIDHFVSIRYNNGVCSYYPNGRLRGDMDASFAPVNAQGEGDINGQYSRYTNLEVPVYHVTGWWDIFNDGQIETHRLSRQHISETNRNLQKIIVGPWAHQTIGGRTTGDMTYKENVADFTKIDIGDIDIDNIPVSNIVNSELIGWFRYNLNYNNFANIGEPKVRIPASLIWQKVNSALGQLEVRVPASEYRIDFPTFFNFINASGPLNAVPVEIKLPTGQITIAVTIPTLEEPLISGLDGQSLSGVPVQDFPNLPAVRFYVVGPVNDGVPENENVGNYWRGSEEFPPAQEVQPQKMYLHQNGTLNWAAPTTDEGTRLYVHDPDDPIATIGGANMIVRTPQDDRDSQGQFNLADTQYASYTMDREGVIKFTSEPVQDSLAIMGNPVFTLYAKSNPGGLTSGPTDTDFFVRVLDVYPDGREMFVFEGCINARAREYARTIAQGQEDPNAPFSNINIGQIYEYKFAMQPIAYVWGKNHRVKILISSSNYTRYQVNPNLPIEDGEYFRRKPGDGRTYIFNGVEMLPRTAVQRVYFSPQHPTHIEFPVHVGSLVTQAPSVEPINSAGLQMLVYPNPANDLLSLYPNRNSRFKLQLTTLTGQSIYTAAFTDAISIPLATFAPGLYLASVTDLATGETTLQKVSVVK